MPAIPVSADEKLVPAPSASVAGHTAAEFLARATSHDLAVLLRARRIAERLMRQIAAIPDQLAEKRDPMIGPVVGGRGFRKCTCQRETIAHSKLGDRRPSAP